MRNSALIRIAFIGTMTGLFSFNSSSFAATFTPVSLDSIANQRIQDMNPYYPEGDFLTRFAVPFEIGVGGNNAWGNFTDGIWSAAVNVGVTGVKSIYTLANTGWGHNGEKRFSVRANFDNGESLTWVYTDGQQLRDWNLYPSFATDINGTNANEVFRVSPPLQVYNSPTPDVLDMQALFVPESYHSLTLETLVFTDDRQTFVHSAFLAGVTLSGIGPVTDSLKPIPVPAAFPLFASAIAWLCVITRRRIMT